MKVLAWQIKTIHAILSKMGKSNDKEYKEHLVLQFTKGRETSTKGMYYAEAKAMIASLNEIAPKSEEDIKAERMRRKILALARKMGWELDNGKVDIRRVDNWCRNNSTLKKGINKHKYSELPALVSQFQNVYKSYLKSL